MRSAVGLTLLVHLWACGGTQRSPALELARLEVARDPAALAGRQDPSALHALGRIGGAAAVAELRAALRSPDEAVVVAAIEGLWFADEPGHADAVAVLEEDPRAAVRLAAVRALGRLGTVAEEPVLVRALTGEDLELRAVAGVAAGVMGRRKAASGAPLAALVENSRHPDPAVRHGAAYGLSYLPGNEGAWEELARLCDDPSPEVRALAYGGLARAGVSSVERLARGLDDPSPWVAVEAVRALSGDKSTPEDRARLASWVSSQKDESHALREALTRLGKHVAEAPVREMFQKRTDCLSRAALLRLAGNPLNLDDCGQLRPALLSGLLADGERPRDERLIAVRSLWAEQDPRLRAVAAEIAPALLPDEEAERVVRAALAAPEPVVAGSAADALAALDDRAPPWVVPLLIERATEVRATDAELFQGFLDALVVLKAKAALPLAAGALTDANPAIRARARAGYKELSGEEPPQATPAPPVPPPVDVEAVLGRRPLLEVQTSEGTFTVELDPAIAPWNTAALVTLARRGFYDGGVFHRVVPGFVVQGGDPTGTGWGGPGFSLPAEMSAVPYRRGTVGIADAGRDTGGSQWFVMHAPAPHLDGRYTVVGQVREVDMAVVDRLVVGSKILKVTTK